MQSVKIFGERNTGTRALSEYVERHSASVLCPGAYEELQRSTLVKSITFNLFGREKSIDKVFDGQPPSSQWKHAATVFSADDLRDFDDRLVIITVRNPLSWLAGLHKKPYHLLKTGHSMTLDDFLSRKWNTFARERIGAQRLTPVELINVKMRSYVSFLDSLRNRDANAKVVLFESFVADPDGVWAKISPYLKSPDAHIVRIEESLKESTKSLSYYQDYYENEKWRALYPADVLTRTSNLIDWDAYATLRSLE